jgi:hypothetical protein
VAATLEFIGHLIFKKGLGAEGRGGKKGQEGGESSAEAVDELEHDGEHNADGRGRGEEG